MQNIGIVWRLRKAGYGWLVGLTRKGTITMAHSDVSKNGVDNTTKCIKD